MTKVDNFYETKEFHLINLLFTFCIWVLTKLGKSILNIQ